MTWSVQLVITCEDDAPTMAQLDAIAEALAALSESPLFEDTDGAYIETGAPSDLDMSKVVKAN